MSKRDRYERANMRGGLGVRKRLSEESLRDSYRLNGVQTGSAVARAHDRLFADFSKGYDLGVIVRKTASTVQVHWVGEEDITSYNQGDARYEVDRGRWKILGPMQGNPLDPNNPLVDALTALRAEYRVQASANAGTPPTEGDEPEMAKEKSNAAREREEAKKALEQGQLKERDTYTAKQVATRCGTDSKTMRKFFRSNHSTVEPVGQGGRYEFDAKDFPQIKREFDAWRKKAKARQPSEKPTIHITEVMDQVAEQFKQDAPEVTPVDDLGPDEERYYEEPSDDELAALEDEEIDLDDLDED